MRLGKCRHEISDTVDHICSIKKHAYGKGTVQHALNVSGAEKGSINDANDYVELYEPRV